jgi:hypothetical protein
MLDFERFTPYIRDLRKKQAVTANSLEKIEDGQSHIVCSLSLLLSRSPFLLVESTLTVLPHRQLCTPSSSVHPNTICRPRFSTKSSPRLFQLAVVTLGAIELEKGEGVMSMKRIGISTLCKDATCPATTIQDVY